MVMLIIYITADVTIAETGKAKSRVDSMFIQVDVFGVRNFAIKTSFNTVHTPPV